MQLTKINHRHIKEMKVVDKLARYIKGNNTKCLQYEQWNIQW
jgi:hypothetical protein